MQNKSRGTIVRKVQESVTDDGLLFKQQCILKENTDFKGWAFIIAGTCDCLEPECTFVTYVMKFAKVCARQSSSLLRVLLTESSPY